MIKNYELSTALTAVFDDEKAVRTFEQKARIAK